MCTLKGFKNLPSAAFCFETFFCFTPIIPPPGAQNLPPSLVSLTPQKGQNLHPTETAERRPVPMCTTGSGYYILTDSSFVNVDAALDNDLSQLFIPVGDCQVESCRSEVLLALNAINGRPREALEQDASNSCVDQGVTDYEDVQEGLAYFLEAKKVQTNSLHINLQTVLTQSPPELHLPASLVVRPQVERVVLGKLLAPPEGDLKSGPREFCQILWFGYPKAPTFVSSRNFHLRYSVLVMNSPLPWLYMKPKSLSLMKLSTCMKTYVSRHE